LSKKKKLRAKEIREKFCKIPQEVANAIEEFRSTLTPEKCQNYINKIHEVIKTLLIIPFFYELSS
jgi:hypothetical protein